MGLLSGRKNDNAPPTNTAGIFPWDRPTDSLGPGIVAGPGTATGVGHRYPTRSQGPAGGITGTTGTTRNFGGPGATTGRTNAAEVDTGAHATAGQSNSTSISSHLPQLMTVPTKGHGSAKTTAGLIERGIGRALHSKTMEMKGDAKVQQGEAEKVSAQHLRDAERLESEAAARRNLAGVEPGVHTTGAKARGNMLR